MELHIHDFRPTLRAKGDWVIQTDPETYPTLKLFIRGRSELTKSSRLAHPFRDASSAWNHMVEIYETNPYLTWDDGV